jgi:hypothetical protein
MLSPSAVLIHAACAYGDLVRLAKEGDEDFAWGFAGSFGPLHTVTFFRIQTMSALSEDPSILSWTASRTPVRCINHK